MGRRFTSNLVSIIAVGAGDGGAVANAQTAWQPSLSGATPSNAGGIPRRVIIRKIMWRNRSGLNGDLFVGYGDRTVAGSLFRRVLPLIYMLNGIDGEIGEDQLPICGNTREGFALDTTAVTGSTGAILVESTIATLGAGTPVEVTMELEEV